MNGGVELVRESQNTQRASDRLRDWDYAYSSFDEPLGYTMNVVHEEPIDFMEAMSMCDSSLWKNVMQKETIFGQE